MKVRLNKYLAMCGIASRRKAEEVIAQGRVRINGKIVLLPSLQIEPRAVCETGEPCAANVDDVTLDGKPLVPEKFIYLVMNKPAGYVCAVSDKYDKVVLEILPEKYRDKRIFPVGRLDRETEGLLILTNDGDFAQATAHPSFEVPKQYEAMLDLPISDKSLERWRRGYKITDSPHWGIEDRIIKPVSIERLEKHDSSLSGNNWVRITISEGLKREVREMARLTGFRVLELVRVKIGKMRLEKLASGEIAELSRDELLEKISQGGCV